MEINLDSNWKKVNEYIDYKFFVNNVPDSPKYQCFLRNLTPEESNIYEIGTEIRALRVSGIGWAIYHNVETDEEYKVVKFFY